MNRKSIDQALGDWRPSHWCDLIYCLILAHTFNIFEPQFSSLLNDD